MSTPVNDLVIEAMTDQILGLEDRIRQYRWLARAAMDELRANRYERQALEDQLRELREELRRYKAGDASGP